MADSPEKLSISESFVKSNSIERAEQGKLHLLSRVSAPLIASIASDAKIHFPSAHNVLKDKETIGHGELLGYKETNGVRTWAAVASVGDTTEKEPQGVFVCHNDVFDQEDKTKYTHPPDTGLWVIVTDGAIVNLSELRVNSAPVITVDPLRKKPVSAKDTDAESLVFEYTVSTDNLEKVQQLKSNTGLTIRNNIPNLTIPIDSINEVQQ